MFLDDTHMLVDAVQGFAGRNLREFLGLYLVQAFSFTFQLQAGQLPTMGKSPPTFPPSFAVGT